MTSVSDFAQNLLVETKVEVSEEHFHKAQIALFATVTSVSTAIRPEGDNTETEHVQHTITQVTSSDNK